MLGFKRAFGWISICFVTFVFLSPNFAQAGKKYEVFDGQIYNGKYYPRIDVMEWSDANEPSRMEFHVYSKAKPVDLSFQYENKNGEQILDVNYYITERKETVCGRQVMLPDHFKDGYLVYKDTSDREYDNIIVSMSPLPEKKGRELIKSPVKYMACGAPIKNDSARTVAGAH
jgi:hypothetical protein